MVELPMLQAACMAAAVDVGSTRGPVCGVVGVVVVFGFNAVGGATAVKHGNAGSRSSCSTLTNATYLCTSSSCALRNVRVTRFGDRRGDRPELQPARRPVRRLVATRFGGDRRGDRAW